MFGFIKQMFVGLWNVYIIENFGELLVSNSKGPLKYLSLNNQSCQDRTTLVNISPDETLLYPYTDCSRICNTIYDPYAQACVQNKAKIYECKSI